MEKTSEITFTVHLDENSVPERIDWKADDTGDAGECDATLLSVWDKKEKNTLRIDLWTKDMMVEDMKLFTYQTLVTMADTFARATDEEALANELREFAQQMAEKMGLIRQG